MERKLSSSNRKLKMRRNDQEEQNILCNHEKIPSINQKRLKKN